MNRYIMIRRLFWPAFLLLVGVIALLSQTHILRWGQSWPLFLIVLGLLLLAERAALTMDGYPPVPGGAWPGMPTTNAANPQAVQSGQSSTSVSIVPPESHNDGNDQSGAQL